MSTLLHIDASPRAARSLSRTLGKEFVDSLANSTSDTNVVYRDLGHDPSPHVTESWVAGAYSSPVERDVPATAAMAISDGLVNELFAAERIVITTPMYNLSIPSTLKAYIDQIVRAGRTFTINDASYVPLVHGKKLLVIVTSGGNFTPGSPGAGYNFVEPYLRAIFGFIGITDVQFVYAHSIALGESQRLESITTARAELTHLSTTW